MTQVYLKGRNATQCSTVTDTVTVPQKHHLSTDILQYRTKLSKKYMEYYENKNTYMYNTHIILMIINAFK